MNFQNLQEIAANTRVVGIGESAHFVHEFNSWRIEMVKFLKMQGFTHIALEIGSIEAARINFWLQGKQAEGSLSQVAGLLTCGIYGDFLHGIREFNKTTNESIQLLGVDLPNSMNLSEELEEITLYLQLVDSQLAIMADEIKAIALKIPSGSSAKASPGWANLDAKEQLKLESTLSRITRRMDVIKPLYVERSDTKSWDKARDHITTANDIVYMLRAITELFSGEGLTADTSIRENHIAGSIFEYLELNPTMRILFVAHNNHIQKEPLCFDGYISAYPAGFYLSKKLGEKYKAIAFTHIGEECPEMIFPVEHSPVGFTVEAVNCGSPPQGSVEKLIIDSAIASQCNFLDLSTNESNIKNLTSIRSQSVFISTKINIAFDGVWVVPKATLTKGLLF